MPVQKIVEGQTATNPSTGEKIVYRGGKWFPVGGQGAASMAGQLSPQERASLDEAQTSARGALETLPDLNRFEEINGRIKTGGLDRWDDFAQRQFNPDFQQMEEISARLTPAQRQPGLGTTSDRDLALFEKAVPSVKNNSPANSAILDRARAEAVRRQQYADFLDDYAAKNGTLNGAEKAFRAQAGLGSRATPYDAAAAGDRSQLPRGSYYMDPQGNLRRNDNGARGNPIIRRSGMTQPRSAGVKTSGSGWKIVD